MAGAYDGSLVFDTKVDTKGFETGTNTLKTQANGIKSTLLSLGKTIGAVFAVTQLVKFGKQAVQLASDIQEVQNVVDTAFGDMAYKMEAFSESAIELYGISKLTAKGTGSTFMAMASGMGLATDMSSDMALQLTALSADMSSFYNKTQEITKIALQSVFTGETETLKQFGIVMTEVNLQAFALSQGITKSYSAMSQAEKVALRYNFVMEQTRLAQGDFAKTQDSWANQTRILSERWKEFLGLLGAGIVKVLTPLVQVLNTALQYMIGFANVITKLLGGEVKKQEQISSSIGGAVDNQEALTQATKGTAKANKKTLASFDEIEKLTNSSAGGEKSGSAGNLGGVDFDISKPYDFDFNTKSAEAGIGNIYKGLEGIKEYLEQFKEPFMEWVDIDLSGLSDILKNSAITIFYGFSETLGIVLRDLFSTTIPQIINTLLTTILPLLTQFLTESIKTFTTLFNVINSLFKSVWSGGIKPAIDLLVDIWSSAWDTIYKFWQTWGEPIFENIRRAIENTGVILQSAWDNMLQPVWQSFMDMVDWLWEKHLQPLLANFLDFVGELINGALEIYNKFIIPIIGWLVENLGPAISNVAGLVIRMAGSVLGTITDVISGIITILKGIVQFITGVFTNDWDKAWQGIKNIFGGIWEAIAGIGKGAVNLIIDFINGMLKSLEVGINKVVKTINKLEITNPFDGSDIWSPNIPTVSFPTIPKLATGTVVPANYGNFLAMLGDNKRETEIVSPLSTMKQALVEALQEYGGQNITINFENSSIGDLVRMLKPYIDKENRRVGNSMRLGGAYR